MAALADETSGQMGPIATVKGTRTCTGTVTDGTSTVSVTATNLTITNDPSLRGNTTEQTCNSLTDGFPGHRRHLRHHDQLHDPKGLQGDANHAKGSVDLALDLRLHRRHCLGLIFRWHDYDDR